MVPMAMSWRRAWGGLLLCAACYVQHQAGIKYPICTEGARRGPPEDVGGVTGYANFLEAWHDPEHEEHAANRRWVGRAFDPEKIDLPAVNKAITSALRKSKGG